MSKYILNDTPTKGRRAEGGDEEVLDDILATIKVAYRGQVVVRVTSNPLSRVCVGVCGGVVV